MKNPNACFAGTGWGLPPDQARYVVCADSITANCVHEVIPALREIEKRVNAGDAAFGFLAYEASAAFDLPTKDSAPGHPLLWFGFCRPGEFHTRLIAPALQCNPSPEPIHTQLRASYTSYQPAIVAIQDAIAEGKTYQTNFTIRTDVTAPQSGEELFWTLYQSHPMPYSAYVRMEGLEILSLSPELFIERQSNWLRSRPMKGTRCRGRYPEEDAHLRSELQNAPKDRAENIMILDMTRNDLGRVCRYGSVATRAICDIETYPTLFQMTSTVEGECAPNTSITDILRATFPAASITGAPKRETMRIITHVEEQPRGVYCGTIGWIQPSGDFCFNVAIRTLSGKNGKYTLGVGGGIVWDSTPEAEYNEALSKMQFVNAAIPSFELIETFRLDADGIYAYRDEHLDRMQRSALYWRFAFDRDKINQRLEAYIAQCDNPPAVVRLTSNQAGAISISERPMTAIPNEVAIVVSRQRVHSGNRFLFHKTTHRYFYQTERQRLTSDQIFEVVFQNEKGHITEGCITNLGYRIKNAWFTPPLEDGLLPGVWRAGFLRTHNARERSLSLAELQQADEVVIGNSVLETIRVDRIRVEARRVSA